MDLIKIMSKHDMFIGCDEATLKGYLSDIQCDVKNYGNKEIVHLEGEVCQTLDLIIKGSVVVEQLDEEGNVLQIVQFKGGDSIGGNLLFGSVDTYPMTITSKKMVQIIHIGKADVLKLSMRSERFLKAFLKSISDKSIILTHKIKSISHTGIRDRIMAYLDYESTVQGSKTIKLTYSKKELAERFGVQRTSLSRELQKMRNEGLIEFDRTTITLMVD